jgi:UDP-N-acetylglucosamine 2-epimerase (non-hydrolysing)
MKNILLVFGTRPEAIKMAPLVKEFQKNTMFFNIKICVTAQHREMLDQVLELFDVSPDYDLNIMKSGQDLFDITSNILLGMKGVFKKFKPDIVLVHGDTSTTLATSISAFYNQIKVGHVEAGLRTGCLYSPWPEEANRQITGVLAHYHFAPTVISRNNLLKENKSPESIVITGNTVIDALLLALKKIKNDRKLEKKIISQLTHIGYKIHSNKIILVTGHRRENHGQGFINICKALKNIALQNPNIDIVYPVHLNPKVQNTVKELLSNINNIYLIKPLQYEHFIYLMDKSYFIITDSGGVQEEAPSLGKPVLLMRGETERPEALDSGSVSLVGTSVEKIVSGATCLINNREYYNKMARAHNPYGDGYASKKIVDFFIEKFNKDKDH